MSASSDYTEYVEAIRGYDYTNDKGENSAIIKGNYYILLERTNSEWWHIQETEQVAESPRDFYVPSGYVQSIGRYPEELDEVFDETGKHREEFYSSSGESGESEDEEPVKIIVPKGKPLPQIPNKSKPREEVNAKAPKRISSFKPLSSTPPADYSDDSFVGVSDNSATSASSPALKDGHTPPHQKIVCVQIDESPVVKLPESKTQPSSPAKFVTASGKVLTPPGKVLPPQDEVLPPPDAPAGASRNVEVKKDEPVVYANLIDLTSKSPSSEVQNQTEYANLNVIQAVLKPPSIPNPGDFVRALNDSWALYSDAETGRKFYYNNSTSETTWKPPRVVLDKQTSDGEADSSLEDRDQHTNGGHDHLPIPRGWTLETTEENKSVYVNDVTREKWIGSVDASGRPYFYKEGSQESAWQLPEQLHSSHSVSESLSHVDVASRSAALRERFSKTKSLFIDGQVPIDTCRKSTTLPPNLTMGLAREHRDISGDLPGSIGNSLSAVNKIFPKPQRSFRRCHGSLWDRPTLRSEGRKVHGEDTEVKDRFLNKAKVMENGKKLKKKTWSLSYVILSGSNLVFYKDQKSSMMRPGSPHGKPEFIISLNGANIEYASRELSSKKNVILITTARSNEDAAQYLLQSDDSGRIQLWYTALAETIQCMRDGLDLPTEVNGSLKKNSSLTSEPEKLKRGKSTKGKPSPSAVRVQRSISTEEAASQERKRRIRDILFNFISRRPSPEVLKEKGIIKEAVFGSELKHLCEREGNLVPQFIRHIITTIEAHGLDHDGMYRVNGNASQIQKLRCMVDQEQKYHFDDPLWDIHVLTGALKLFFRELREPLFPFHSYEKFVSAISMKTSSEKMKAFKEHLHKLPKCHHETIRFLFCHLRKVTQQSKENRMQSHNLAIVFGPTLMWPELRAPNLACSLVFQNRVVEFFLLEFDNLFRS